MTRESEQQERLEFDVTDPDRMPEPSEEAARRRAEPGRGPEEEALHLESDSDLVEPGERDLPDEQ